MTADVVEQEMMKLITNIIRDAKKPLQESDKALLLKLANILLAATLPSVPPNDVTFLAGKIIMICDGVDSEKAITALGMAAATSVVYGAQQNNAPLRRVFIDHFINACDQMTGSKTVQ